MIFFLYIAVYLSTFILIADSGFYVQHLMVEVLGPLIGFF